MGTALTAKPCVQVTLLSPGADLQTLALPENATLDDLLREAGVGIRSPNIMIDGRPIEEALILKSGMVITVVPEVPQAPSKRSWLNTVGMFADDPDFEAMVEAGRAIREADRKATLEEMDREDPASGDS